MKILPIYAAAFVAWAAVSAAAPTRRRLPAPTSLSSSPTASALTPPGPYPPDNPVPYQ